MGGGGAGTFGGASASKASAIGAGRGAALRLPDRLVLVGLVHAQGARRAPLEQPGGESTRARGGNLRLIWPAARVSSENLGDPRGQLLSSLTHSIDPLGEVGGDALRLGLIGVVHGRTVTGSPMDRPVASTQ